MLLKLLINLLFSSNKLGMLLKHLDDSEMFLKFIVK